MANTHQKAAEVFAASPPFFATLGSFAEAFPTVEEASVVVTETDCGHPVRTHHANSKTGMGEFVNCSNPRCYNGGVNVGNVIREMIRTGAAEHAAERVKCQGYEGSPKGRRNYSRCYHSFAVKATVVYKAPSA